MEQLQAVLDTFDRLEDECYDRMAYMDEHNFNYEKQAIEIRRQAYHKCFRELQKTLNRQQVDEWTVEDEFHVVDKSEEMILFEQQLALAQGFDPDDGGIQITF